jgi:hypothetical protein
MIIYIGPDLRYIVTAKFSTNVLLLYERSLYFHVTYHCLLTHFNKNVKKYPYWHHNVCPSVYPYTDTKLYECNLTLRIFTKTYQDVERWRGVVIMAHQLYPRERTPVPTE